VLVGYARVSTAAQTLALQEGALLAAGCSTMFTDHALGAQRDRPGLADALAALQAGDVLVVWRLDRRGRSLNHLITLVETLRDHEVGFRSLQVAMVTTTPGAPSSSTSSGPWPSLSGR
jgi:DNA invertase Pin-like site-specific DNA recombinase